MTRPSRSSPIPQQNAGDIYAINLAKTEYREGYNTADVERLLSAFADGFLYFSEGTPSFGGEESKLALAAQARELFRKYHVKMFVIIAVIQLFGDFAYDWGWHELALTPKAGGQPFKVRRRYVELWQKSADGQWKIHLFLDNNDQPPTMLDSYLATLKVP